MSKLRYTISDERALHVVHEAFRRGQYPDNIKEITERLDKLAESRRNDRFETVTDATISRPLIRIIVQVLQNEVAADKLIILATHFEELFEKLPHPMPDEMWAPRRKPAKDFNFLELPEAPAKREEELHTPTLTNEHRLLRHWLLCQQDPDNGPGEALPAWDKVIFTRMLTNDFLPRSVRSIIAKDTATPDELDQIFQYLETIGG
jgi:hypothetical protein